MTAALLFNALAELLFWIEFETRFNFIAVDYLVYTREVIGNIRESYPVMPLLMAVAALAALLTWTLRGPLARAFGVRLARGAHFLSHVLLTAWICFAVAWACHWAWKKRESRARSM